MIRNLIIGPKHYETSQDKSLILDNVEILTPDQASLKNWTESMERIPIQITCFGFIEIKEIKDDKALLKIHIG